MKYTRQIHTIKSHNKYTRQTTPQIHTTNTHPINTHTINHTTNHTTNTHNKYTLQTTQQTFFERNTTNLYIWSG
jgi:hypothetical protein